MFASHFCSNSFCTHTRTHTHINSSKSPFSVFKSALILLGLTKVLQTNIMDNNQLCSSQCIGLFCHAQMTKHNNAVFLIKEEVINLMISSPRVPYKPPSLLTALYLSHSFCFCVDVCVYNMYVLRVGRGMLAIRLSDEECLITVLLTVDRRIKSHLHV